MHDAILSVEDVTVGFDGFTVLDRLSFSVGYGELRFLIGPNGAGKTTLLDIITGKTRPTTGQVSFDGDSNLHLRSEHQIARRGIARKFQTPAVFPHLTVLENLEVAAGGKLGLPALLRPCRAVDRTKWFDTLASIGLHERSNVMAGTLSHGERQWLEIGMLLVQDPKLLLLDEPVAGLTRRERDQTGELLETIVGQRAVVVVEHDMAFVRQFARTVTVLHLGRVLSEGPVDHVQSDERVVEAYLGRGHGRHTGSDR